MALPQELINMIMLYVSHPVADAIEEFKEDKSWTPPEDLSPVVNLYVMNHGERYTYDDCEEYNEEVGVDLENKIIDNLIDRKVGRPLRDVTIEDFDDYCKDLNDALSMDPIFHHIHKDRIMSRLRKRENYLDIRSWEWEERVETVPFWYQWIRLYEQQVVSIPIPLRRSICIWTIRY